MYQIINIRIYIETTQWLRFLYLYTQRSCFFYIYCVSYHISNQNDNVQIKMIAYQINIRKYIETTLLFVHTGHAFYLLCFISCIKKMINITKYIHNWTSNNICSHQISQTQICSIKHNFTSNIKRQKREWTSNIKNINYRDVYSRCTTNHVGTEQPIINALKYQQIVFILRQFYNFKLLANKNHPIL